MKKIFLILCLFGMVLNSHSQWFERTNISATEELRVRDTLINDLIEEHTSGSSVSAGSGLTKTGSVIDLKGSANQNITINGVAYDLSFGTSGSRFDDASVYSGSVVLNASSSTLGVSLTAGSVTYTLKNGYFISNSGDTLATLDDIAADIVQQAPALALNFDYTYSATTTDSRPGIGFMRLNNASPASVTQIYIDDFDLNSIDKSIFIQLADTGSYFYMTEAGDFSNAYTYEIAGIIDASGYTKYVVTYVNSIGTIPAGGVKLGIINRSGSSTFDVFEYIDLDTTIGSATAQRGRVYYDSLKNALAVSTSASDVYYLGDTLEVDVAKIGSGTTYINGNSIQVDSTKTDIVQLGDGSSDTFIDSLSVTTQKIISDTISISDSAFIYYDINEEETVFTIPWRNTFFRLKGNPNDAVITMTSGGSYISVIDGGATDGNIVLKSNSALYRIIEDTIYADGTELSTESSAKFKNYYGRYAELDSFSIGGGHVRTTSNTIDAQTAIQSIDFDSLRTRVARIDTLYTTLPHAAIYRNTDLTIVSTLNIWYKITGFTTKHNDLLTVQGDSVQLSMKGHYNISYTTSFSGNNGEVWELGVFKNAVLEEPSQLRYTSTSDVGNISVPVDVYSDGDDWISFKIRNTTDSDDPTIKRFSVVIRAIDLEE